MTSVYRRAVLAVTERAGVRGLVAGSSVGREVATRFVAGETLAEALRVAKEQNRLGASVSLDHLGEHVADAGEAATACDAYREALDAIAADGIDGNISIKLTQLGLGLDDALAAELTASLAGRARETGTTLSIDMEDSRYTEATIRLFEQVQREFGNVGVALQASLYRSAGDLRRVIAAGGHVRICKGAYAEPSEVARQGGSGVNRAFDELARVGLTESTIAVAVATHDDERIRRARELAAGRAGHWELQMLYGVRPGLQQRLLADGCRLRVYVPYGTAWYPYLTRRLAERPANLTFFLRALVSQD
ncbi:MAG: proline dehydrogenase family protein [Gaiellales bacterium]